MRSKFLYPSPPPDQIKRLRVSRNLLVKEAAGLCLISPRSWTRFECGKAAMPPSVWKLFKILARRIEPQLHIDLEGNITGFRINPMTGKSYEEGAANQSCSNGRPAGR